MSEHRHTLGQVVKMLGEFNGDLEVVSMVVKVVTPEGNRMAYSINATGKSHSYAPWRRASSPRETGGHE